MPMMKKNFCPMARLPLSALGAARRFVFRHKKDKEKAEIMLEHGSLLLMRAATQSHWEHSLPVMKRGKWRTHQSDFPNHCRISLLHWTFGI